MNTQRFKLRAAKPSDAPQMQTILEETAFKGGISLKYTRRPDVFKSFQREGEEVHIIVCETAEGRIAGFGAIAIRKLYANGAIKKLAYLFGMRLSVVHRTKMLRIHEAYQYLLKQCGDVHLIYTSILSENTRVQKMLEKKRTFMPTYKLLSNYTTYVLTPRYKKKNVDGLIFRRCEEKDIPPLYEYLKREGSCYNCFPEITLKQLKEGELAFYNYYIVLKNENIVAAGAANDQSAYKQLYVEGYKGYYRLLSMLSPVLSLVGFPKLEQPGNKVLYFSLSHFLVANNCTHAAAFFLDCMRSTMIGFSYFVLGLVDGHPLSEMLFKASSIRYYSKIYSVNSGDVELSDRTIYIDCSSL